MSVVIVGGNECMERKYIDICKEHKCTAKVFTKLSGRMKTQIGTPDLLVLFTNTMSHKMLKVALCEVKGYSTAIARSHSGSISSLRAILNKHVTDKV